LIWGKKRKENKESRGNNRITNLTVLLSLFQEEEMLNLLEKVPTQQKLEKQLNVDSVSSLKVVSKDSSVLLVLLEDLLTIQ
jgi:hypothetical protein